MLFSIRKIHSCQDSNSQCPASKTNALATEPKNLFPDAVVRGWNYTTQVCAIIFSQVCTFGRFFIFHWNFRMNSFNRYRSLFHLTICLYLFLQAKLIIHNVLYYWQFLQWWCKFLRFRLFEIGQNVCLILTQYYVVTLCILYMKINA